MTNSMDDLSKRLRNAHTQVTDKAPARLSSEENKEAAFRMYADINSDLEALRGNCVSMGYEKSEKICKSLLQNMADLKAMMDTESVQSK
jgi:polyhydroxyalkanoate synthesis regulator phasin